MDESTLRGSLPHLKATGPYSECFRMVSGLHLLWMTVSPSSNWGSLQLFSAAQVAKATWVSLIIVGRIQVHAPAHL